MAIENIQRCFNLNNFETQKVEGKGQDDDPHHAYLKAELDALNKIRQTMIRVYNVRKEFGIANDFDDTSFCVIAKEIQGIESELGILNE